MSQPVNATSSVQRARVKQPAPGRRYFIYAIFTLIAMAGAWKWFDFHPAIDVADRNEILSFLALIIFPLFVLFLVFQKMSSESRAAREVSSYQASLEKIQKRLNLQENFLRIITDHDSEDIIIFDKDDRYWFVNSSAVKSMRRDVREIIGLTPSQLLDRDRAQQIVTRLDKVRRSGDPIDALEQVQTSNGQTRHIQTHYKILDAFNDFAGGVLLREEDVTNLVVERERRENMLRQVLQALVAVVDRRDPYAAGHSARVGRLSRLIAEEMVLPERQIEAAEIAGSLMNFGKVLVSRGILTKTSALTPEELQRVRDSILTSADILSVIDFSAPVIPTLKQVLEHVDGSGLPDGIHGDKIIITARIVAVANTYVALVSPRAHRPSLGLKAAVEIMMRDVDRIYDRAVVQALSHYIDNHANKLDWLTASKQN